MSSDDEKYRIRDKEPGWFDSLFDTDWHEKEIVNSNNEVVGTIRDKEPGLIVDLFGADRREQEIVDPDDDVIATIRDKEPGLFGELLNVGSDEREIVDPDGDVIATIRDKDPGLFDELLNVERDEQEIVDPDGDVVATILSEEPGLLGSLFSIDRHEKEIRSKQFPKQRCPSVVTVSASYEREPSGLVYARPSQSATCTPRTNAYAPGSNSGIVMAVLAVLGTIALIATGNMSNGLRRTQIETSTPALSSTVRTSFWTLFPVDEADEDPSLLQFRQKLLQAIDRRDWSFLASILSPTIAVGFGDKPNTAQEFMRHWSQDGQDSSVWYELGKVMKMGGAFVDFNGRHQFIAPYVSSSWPKNMDCFSYAAVIAPSVRLHIGPGLGTKPIGVLSYDLVKIQAWTVDRKWVKVSTEKGLSGYISSDSVRSPINYRAAFERIGDRWVMVSFVSGD
jgi:hypothetical protein